MLFLSFLFSLIELNCITKHKHFEPIVLLEDNLWTALVGMHDRESAYLPERSKVPNE